MGVKYISSTQEDFDFLNEKFSDLEKIFTLHRQSVDVIVSKTDEDTVYINPKTTRFSSILKIKSKVSLTNNNSILLQADTKGVKIKLDDICYRIDFGGISKSVIKRGYINIGHPPKKINQPHLTLTYADIRKVKYSVGATKCEVDYGPDISENQIIQIAKRLNDK
jgi:hypothetical protein